MVEGSMNSPGDSRLSRAGKSDTRCRARQSCRQPSSSAPAVQLTDTASTPFIRPDPYRHVGGFQGLLHDGGQVVADRVQVHGVL